jgi:two-component system sensor histidine kinase CreC
LLDETLITHAVWSMLMYAGVISAPNETIDLAIERSDARALVRLQLHGPTLPPVEEMRAFEPFSMIQYEGRPRSAMGLFLCREIARVHGGGLRLSERPDLGPVLTMDLPA